MIENRRAAILEATERLLRRYGPGKTTMADVAREAEISVGSVYLEFDSKESIIEELSLRRHAQILDAMHAAASTTRPVAERLRAVFDARTDGFLDAADGGAHAADLVHCTKSASVKTAHERFKSDERDLVLELVRVGGRAGELEAPRPEVVADAVLAAYARFSPPWIYQSSRDDARTLLRAVHEVVLYGIVRRKRR